MTASITAISQNLNESLSSWVARIDAFLLAQGPVGLDGLGVNRQQGMSTDLLVATFTLVNPGPLQARAALFTGSPLVPSDVLVNAFLASNPPFNYKVAAIRDVSDPLRRGLNDDAVLLIYSTNSVSNCAQGQCRINIAYADADAEILPGATGTAHIASNTGPTSIAIQVENRSAVAWPASGAGYVAPLLGDCGWVGIPSCCGVVPVTSTTTTTSSSTTTQIFES